MTMKYWLMKTEPTTYSIEDLEKETNQTTCWEGVRNYQARNLLRDDIQEGDRVLFYHSACKEPAVVERLLCLDPGILTATPSISEVSTTMQKAILITPAGTWWMSSWNRNLMCR